MSSNKRSFMHIHLW